MKNKIVCLMAFLAIAAFSNAAVVLTGGDAGQGLTLDSGNVVGALNVGSGYVDPGGYPGSYTIPLVVQGVSFADDIQNPWTGITWVGGAGGWSGELGGAFAFDAGETSSGDTNLARICQTLYFGGSWVRVRIGGLNPGSTYKFDVITSLASYSGPRNIKLFAQNTGQSAGTIMDTITAASGVAYNSTFEWQVGSDGKVDIGGIPGVAPADGAWLNGIVVTVPEPATMMLLGLGSLGLLKRRS